MGDQRTALRPNFSTGVLYYGKLWFVGASMPFMLTHRYSSNQPALTIVETGLQAQPMLTGGYVLSMNEDLKWKPSALLRYRLETGLQADISSNLIIKDKVWIGASWRSGDAVIGMLEVLPNHQWRFGYAYDLGISATRNYHHGTHEVMVQYELGYRIRVRDPRYF
jgi:type IX secretion system PorP/SprF family membrane protein